MGPSSACTPHDSRSVTLREQVTDATEAQRTFVAEPDDLTVSALTASAAWLLFATAWIEGHGTPARTDDDDSEDRRTLRSISNSLRYRSFLVAVSNPRSRTGPSRERTVPIMGR